MTLIIIVTFAFAFISGVFFALALSAMSEDDKHNK